MTAEHLTPEALARLTELAEAATPGPWEAHEHDPTWGEWAIYSPDAGHDFGLLESRTDAEFIAAANPDTIRALVAEVTRLRDGIAGLADEYDAYEASATDDNGPRIGTSRTILATRGVVGTLRALLDGGAA